MNHHHSGYAHNRRSVAQRWIFFPLCLLALVSFLFTPPIGDAATTTVQLTPTSLHFACYIHYPWGCVLTKTAKLTNTGSNVLVIASITFVPGNYCYLCFSETNTCPKNLNPGQSCSITVTARPHPYQTSTGYVHVTDNASGSPQIIYLSEFVI